MKEKSCLQYSYGHCTKILLTFRAGRAPARRITQSHRLWGCWILGVGFFRDPNSYWRTQFKLIRVSLHTSSLLGMFFTQGLGTQVLDFLGPAAQGISWKRSQRRGVPRSSTVPLPPYPPEDLGSTTCPFSKGTTMRAIQGIFHCSDQIKTTILSVS